MLAALRTHGVTLEWQAESEMGVRGVTAVEGGTCGRRSTDCSLGGGGFVTVNVNVGQRGRVSERPGLRMSVRADHHCKETIFSLVCTLVNWVGKCLWGRFLVFCCFVFQDCSRNMASFSQAHL